MKSRSIFIALALTLVCFAQVFAQRDRAFVSTSGADTINCGDQTSPCRSFSGALAALSSGGSAIALDSGIYDAVNISITKSATLMAAPGVHAELFNNYINPDRITVNAGATSRVTLKNLYITNLSGEFAGQGNGIKVTSVGVLQIENCVVDGFSTGVSVSLTHAAQISIKDTIIRNNSIFGAAFDTTTGILKGSIDNCHFDNNAGTDLDIAAGLLVGKHSRVTIRDSVATGNSGAGFLALDDKAEMNLERCESSNNRDGVRAWNYIEGAVTTTTVSNSIITSNSRNGFSQQGAAVFQSMVNNTVRHNGTNTVGTIGAVSGT